MEHEHGDLRVPHSSGCSGAGAPLFAQHLARLRLRQGVRVPVPRRGSYAALYAILAAQALRGVPLVSL